MEPEEIKVGEKYNFTLLATGKAEYGLPATFETPTGRQVIIRPDDYEAVSPLNGIKNTEPAPKYDPCRLFKAGDIVSPTFWNNRKPWEHSTTKTALIYSDWKCTVIADEHHGVVKCKTEKGYVFETAPCFIKLVTPVEELVPYSIDPANTNVMLKRGKKFAIFEDDDEAQELCDRLNAEYRKEVEE